MKNLICKLIILYSFLLFHNLLILNNLLVYHQKLETETIKITENNQFIVYVLNYFCQFKTKSFYIRI